ncbi:MAG: glycosyltransferase [Candidatus Omnitrophica bacterium]|nr:glycosyltransferase [Candidatus Omnitrophota bacterium]
MKLGIVVSQFPELHETFILKEFLALREVGVELRIFSLKKCRDRIIHPEVGSLLHWVEYAPLSSPTVWGEGLLEFLRQPMRSIEALGEMMADGKDFVSFLKVLVVYVKTLALVHRAKGMRIGHLHSHWATFPTTSARMMARLLNLPFSFTGHAWDLYVGNPTLKEKLEEAEFVVTCTEHNRKFLSTTSPGCEQKIFLNYHGVDLNRFQKREPLRKEGTPLILSVGRVVETKGFFTLIRSLSLLKAKRFSFECVIVGEGPLRSKLEEEIKEEQLEHVVRLAGSLSREELLDYYRKAACFVLPSEIAPSGDRDGIPNVLLEAMAVGIPVVSTEISGIPEAVTSGRNGLLVPEKNPAALAGAIETILKDPPLANRYGEEAHRTVSEKFNSDLHLKALSRLFEEKTGKIKILYVIWSLEMGGAEGLVVSLAEGLDRRRFDPLICCLNHPGSLAERLIPSGIPVVALHKRSGLDFSVIPKLVTLMRKEKVQIVHTHLWGANVWGRIAAWLAGVPVRIATEHGIQEWRGPLHRFADKVLSLLCHKIIFVAEMVRQEFCKVTSVAERKCTVIPNGIDTERFKPDPDCLRWRKELGFSVEKKIALSIGRLAPEKRHDIFLKALKEPSLARTDLNLILVGEGQEREELLRLKARLGLDGRVQFLGERENVEGIYRSADLFVLTSSREALSLAVLEAMATELPVIVSRVGDHARLIQDGQNGFLISVGDVKALSGKIAYLLDHPEEAKRIGKEARKTVLSHYSREKLLRDTEKLYEELLHDA